MAESLREKNRKLHDRYRNRDEERFGEHIPEKMREMAEGYREDMNINQLSPEELRMLEQKHNLGGRMPRDSFDQFEAKKRILRNMIQQQPNFVEEEAPAGYEKMDRSPKKKKKSRLREMLTPEEMGYEKVN